MKNVGDNTNIGRESLKKVQTMNAFYYLNYVIYDWYKKRDSAPLSASFFLPILFLYFNVFSIIYWLSIFFNFTPPFVKSNAIAFFIALTSVSYFTLYNRSRYKEIFSQFEEKKEEMNHYKKYVRVYIIATIVLLLATLVAADIRVDGHL